MTEKLVSNDVTLRPDGIAVLPADGDVVFDVVLLLLQAAAIMATAKTHASVMVERLDWRNSSTSPNQALALREGRPRKGL